MRKLMNYKNASFDIIMSKEEESDSKNIKGTQDVRRKPQKMDEKPRLSKKESFLFIQLCIVWKKR